MSTTHRFIIDSNKIEQLIPCINVLEEILGQPLFYKDNNGNRFFTIQGNKNKESLLYLILDNSNNLCGVK